jgi:hypothetical protein
MPVGQNVVGGDLVVQGTLSAQAMNLPANAVADAAVKAAAGIAATKLEHQHALRYSQPAGTAVVSETAGLFICRGATGTIVQLDAAILGAIATDASRTVTVDLQKGNAGTAFATVLSAPLSFGSTDVLRTVKTAAPIVTTLAAGDQLRVVVTVAGGVGAQAQGLVVTATVREAAA